MRVTNGFQYLQAPDRRLISDWKMWLWWIQIVILLQFFMYFCIINAWNFFGAKVGVMQCSSFNSILCYIQFFVYLLVFFFTIPQKIDCDITVGAASQWWLNERMMVYIKLMMVKWVYHAQLNHHHWLAFHHHQLAFYHH